jgi:hypothetical protein
VLLKPCLRRGPVTRTGSSTLSEHGSRIPAGPSCR